MKARIITKTDQKFLDKIETLLFDRLGVEMSVIKAANRTREVVKLRCILAYLIKKHTSMTLLNIGTYFNGKDHSSIIHMLNIIDDWKLQPKAWSNELNVLNDLENILNGYTKKDLIKWLNKETSISEDVKNTIITKINVCIL
jgi:chromosomal replication initiation ATPase DnaA